MADMKVVVDCGIPVGEKGHSKTVKLTKVDLVQQKKDLKSSEKRKWRRIRNERDALLKTSDFTQFPDSPFSETEKEAWKEYRQELRDLPGLFENPDEVEFPDPPK